LNKIVILDYN